MYIYNLKKFKLLAFWRKFTPFIGQKCTYEKVPKNWAGPPPSFGQNPKEQQFFLRIPSLAHSMPSHVDSIFLNIMFCHNWKTTLIFKRLVHACFDYTLMDYSHLDYRNMQRRLSV